MQGPRVLLATLLLATAACDTKVDAAGRVRTASGAPLAGVEISLLVNEEERTGFGFTDSLGGFAVTRIGPRRPPFELRVCLDGYRVEARTYHSREALADSIEFVLTPTGPVRPARVSGRRCRLAPPPDA